MALSDPAAGLIAVVPHDSNGIGRPVRSLYVGGAGDISIVAEDGTQVTLVGVAAGQVLPIRCTRVNLTGTTATNIVGLI